MSEFNLLTADKAALKKYAIDELDLPLSMNMSEDTMRQKIIDRCGILGIEPPAASVEAKGPSAKGMKYHMINISKQTQPGDHGVGAAPVFVGFQAKGYTIPRGIPVRVPYPLVEILKNAVQDIVTQDPDTGEIYHEDVFTHPFSDMGEVA